MTPVCREEAEANFAAGRLLFLRERFTQEARSLGPSIKTITVLKKIFGNTLSTTLYQVVEAFGAYRPLVGMISGHPHSIRRRGDFDRSRPCRHFIRSPAFRRQFGKFSEVDLLCDMSSNCGAQQGGPLGEDELIISDDNGDPHHFQFETFFNRHDALTPGKYIRPARKVMPMSAVKFADQIGDRPGFRTLQNQ